MMKRKAWLVSMLFAGAAVATTALGQAPSPPSNYGRPASYNAPAPAMPAYMPPMMPGQGMQPMVGPPGMPGQGMPPGMQNPYGPPMYGPPQYPGAQAGYMGPPSGAGPEQGYEGGGEYGAGCEDGNCDDGYLGRPGCLKFLLPYDDGGCCAPHWFDVHAEYVYLQRDRISRRLDLVSDTILGPIVLSTDDLSFDPANGFRATVTRQMGVGSNIEFTYMGQHSFSSSASVSSANNSLFSAYSDFGIAPLFGFQETDQASFASVSYSSNFDNYELNFRKRFQTYGCKVQGSWISGVRHFDLNESFIFSTVVPINQTFSQTSVSTTNPLTGAQMGGDIWVCIIPGLSIGAEGKSGLYLNSAHQSTTISAPGSPNLPLSERVDDDEFAMMAEGSVMANWRVNQQWTVRGGYTALYVDGVALAPDNFNATPPFVQPPFINPPRVPTIDTSGSVFLHGFTFGFEYMW